MAETITDLSKINWERLLIQYPHNQIGGKLIGFKGTEFQRGYGGLGAFFKSLFRLARPVASKILKTVARQGIKTASNIGTDILEGRQLKESAKTHGLEAGKTLLKKGNMALRKKLKRKKQFGKGKIGYKLKRKKSNINKGKRLQKGFGKKKSKNRPKNRPHKSIKVKRKGKRKLTKSDFLGRI